MARNKGLGRGLDALLSGEGPTTARDALIELPPSALRPGRYQPRTQMSADAIGELAASIKAQGMIQPILARPVGDRQYEIIAGERRWRAAQQAGLQHVPVLVREVPDEAALSMALIENIQREDLNAIEEAAGLQRLIDEFGMTHQAAGEAVGRSRTAVSNLLRLLQLPRAVQQMMLGGQLEMGHGRALLGLPPSRQLELAESIGAKGLSVRETERLAASTPGRTARVRRQTPADRDVRALEESLAEVLGTSVRLEPGRKGHGRVVIAYHSLDHLDTLIEKFRGRT